MRLGIGLNAVGVVLLMALGSQSVSAQAPPTVARLQAGEQLRHLYFTVRLNYVAPQAVTLEEGWYQIHIYNPNGVASKKGFSLDDEGGKALAVSETSEKSSQTAVLYRFTPGKHALKLDNKQTWTVAITVQAKAK